VVTVFVFGIRDLGEQGVRRLRTDLVEPMQALLIVEEKKLGTVHLLCNQRLVGSERKLVQQMNFLNYGNQYEKWKPYHGLVHCHVLQDKP